MAKKYYSILLFVFVLVLTSCGIKKSDNNIIPNDSSVILLGESGSNTFISEAGTSIDNSVMTDYIPNVFPSYTGMRSYNLGFAQDSNAVYSLVETCDENERKIHLYCFDGNKKETKEVIYDMDDINGMLSDPYAFSGRIIGPSDVYGLDGPGIKLDERSVMPIAGKKDGSSYINEYLELLKSCDNVFLGGASTDTIIEIVREEAAGFFNDEKTAEETAEIIQSRVKLFLMEIQ